MKIGVDFDNTIVCYDNIFHKEAVLRELIPKHIAPNKSSIRDYLRSEGKEKLWTELQGYIYGPGIIEAMPFPGVLNFFEQCFSLGISTCIISHKTKLPYAGSPYNLHESALAWLTSNRFLDAERTGIDLTNVFFADSKQSKIQTIEKNDCSIFIDDLPEFLAEESFPHSVQRILFDPTVAHGSIHQFKRIASWTEALNLIALVP